MIVITRGFMKEGILGSPEPGHYAGEPRHLSNPELSG